MPSVGADRRLFAHVVRFAAIIGDAHAACRPGLAIAQEDVLRPIEVICDQVVRHRLHDANRPSPLIAWPATSTPDMGTAPIRLTLTWSVKPRHDIGGADCASPAGASDMNDSTTAKAVTVHARTVA